MPARKKTPGDESLGNSTDSLAADSAAPSQDGILGSAPGASEDQPATADSESPATPAATGESGPEGVADSPPAPETAVAPSAGVSGPALPTPPTEPGTGGERNPAYLRALRAADPDKFAATCARLRIYGDDIEKALRDPVEE